MRLSGCGVGDMRLRAGAGAGKCLSMCKVSGMALTGPFGRVVLWPFAACKFGTHLV